MGTTAAVALSPTLGLVVMNKLGFTALFICSALVLALSAVGWSTIEIPKPRRRAENAPKESIWNKIYDTKIVFQTILLLLYGIARGTQQSFLTVMATEEGLTMITIYSVFETVSSFLMRFVIRKSFDRFGPGPTILTGGIASVTAFFLFSIVKSNAVLLIAAVCTETLLQVCGHNPGCQLLGHPVFRQRPGLFCPVAVPYAGTDEEPVFSLFQHPG